VGAAAQGRRHGTAGKRDVVADGGSWHPSSPMGHVARW
jgi:hypothetical protein